jgi:twitching motility protein PilU
MEREQAVRLTQNLLRKMIERNGSDLFITRGFPPAIKVDGTIHKATDTPLTADQSAMMVRSIMNDKQIKEFDATKECNFAIAPQGIGRFRVSAFIQQGYVGAVLRTITTEIPTLEDLDLPPILKDVVMNKRGLVIVVGGTGSGKSTTLAAMIGHRNENSRGHIVSIEDPVEYVHPHKGCVITQREVGLDTESWHNALRNTLRQAPDVILIGEIRDRETMQYGIQFSETGHLCLATLHANSANQALDRIINFFQQRQPGSRQNYQLLSRGAPPAIADGPVPEYQGFHFAAPDSARGRHWPHCCDGNHAQHATGCRSDLQRRSWPDQGNHVEVDTSRHADLRPGTVLSL